ncbi:hypothetical protein O6H91_02G010500 [Diphasiastrum complanatum]|uniref:Uncharacterized protein n=1 Tax=Diphasiastrum complanatum TaxID=34168 RepID=A0ACC2ED63_DIPCM|nr:hypothetical protein O6H91_02G010500 [Diphasiastrum complanatum]
MSGRKSISVRRSTSLGKWEFGSGITSFTNSQRSAADDDEEALTWAAIERLPTHDRLTTSILKDLEGNTVTNQIIDVRKFGLAERQSFINKLIKMTEEDNQIFLTKLRNRIDRVGIQLPTVLVQFQNLTVDVSSYTHTQSLPTLWSAARNLVKGSINLLGLFPMKKSTLTILEDISGIIRPRRMTLLLGPPGSGKTTLLLALAGKLDASLHVSGNVTFNGHCLSEFVPQKTSAYISQYDLHIGELTVRETLEFSAKCQGVGTKYELLEELARREKQAGIFPEADIDLYMKATSTEGTHSSLIAEYAMKILGMDVCADILVGDNLRRGISGGQKKRVTSGEMIVGPAKTFMMDEISTGLDSSTTYQIVKCLQQFVHLLDNTICMSLLQPAPEAFELFDDIILLSEGQIVYQGPREHVLEFFEICGFTCPDRKGIADFLQEVISPKDQARYWCKADQAYRYISVKEFYEKFQQFHVGQQLAKDISTGYDKQTSHKAALESSKYSIRKIDLLKVCIARELLLLKRNSFIFVFKGVQLIIVACIGTTVYLRTRMHQDTEQDAFYYLGAIFFSLIFLMFNGFAEIPMTILRLPVFYKQRDLYFYPAWAFSIPSIVVKIPISLIETGVWASMIYYVIGFAPEASRFFRFYLVLFLFHQMSASLFRLLAGLCRTMVLATTGGSFTLLIIFMLGGFIIPRDRIPNWWIWGYWLSPLQYAENAVCVNEFLAPRWHKVVPPNNYTLGYKVLKDRGLFTEGHWYWIGTGALLGFVVLFNILFTLALTYLSPLNRPQTIVFDEDIVYSKDQNGHELEQNLGSRHTSGVVSQSSADVALALHKTHGMMLPFQPLVVSFENINYKIDMPPEMKQHGFKETKLQLLSDITGAFRPGVLTALMGVSGAGKTTLMDVLAGRKTYGYVEGDIRISGFPKMQETFARVAGYCEQTDIHSPQVTVHESLIFSAWLRLSKDIDSPIRLRFIDEVMELVELDLLKDCIVGIPGVTGLSTEQRKRLTIAVELVANPSIIFMDEPTSGLDARAAAIVMRTVRNTVNTGRTVVCTIHQPSIDIFESFDELLLLKQGGRVIYAGPLGQYSHELIEYFEAIPGIPKMKDGSNPATWMLDITSPAAEQRLGIDFAKHYQNSSLYQQNNALVKELSHPAPGAVDLLFKTQYSKSFLSQFKACLWKQYWTYWRSPDYNGVRFLFTAISSLVFGTVFWRFGHKRSKQQDLLNVMGAMYGAVMFVGINNSSTVQPVVATERTVFYRERAARMYSSLPYALAQVAIEIPYVLFQTVLYGIITYSLINFEWKVEKFFWYLFIMFFTFLYFTYYGMMAVAISPNHHIAAILASAFYSIFNLFSGFVLPMKRIPNWWIWYYWICPVAWTVNGLITSQYGDLSSPLQIPGEPDKPVKQFLKDYFGYHHDFLGAVAGALIGFAVLFAMIFAICVKCLNFQHR